MEAYLYDLKLYFEGQELPREVEFIVASKEAEARDGEARRIYDWYLNNSKTPVERSVLGMPQAIESSLLTSGESLEIHWPNLQHREIEQRGTRPRGIGCTFRGGFEGHDETLSQEVLEEIRDSLIQEIDSHPSEGARYLFVGSRWDENSRLRTGEVRIFEADGIEAASAIIELYFFNPVWSRTYTNWCCPIYIAGEA